MKRVNISNDVESRRNIATATPKTPVILPEPVVEPINTEEKEDGKTEEVQGSEDNAPAQAELDTPPKRGRKTTGNAQKV